MTSIIVDSPGTFEEFGKTFEKALDGAPANSVVEAYSTALSNWRVHQIEGVVSKRWLSSDEKARRAELGVTVLRVDQHLELFPDQAS